MITTIDEAGRLVIPKEVRVQAQLEAGQPILVRYIDGHVELEPAPRPVTIVKRGRLRVAVPASGSAALRDGDVRLTRDRVRSRER